jgi:hypothetical protein
MTVTPTLHEAIERVIQDDRSTVHTSFPARVLAYDAEAQTLDVRPALLREVPSDSPGVPWGFEQLPDILSAQVMWPRAGGFVITFPIAVGDWVLVLCAEQATSLWRTRAQAPSHPGLVDPHGLNGCVCLPGWFPDKQKLGNVSATDLVIGKTDASSTIAIKPDGTIVLGADISAKEVALADLVSTAIAYAVTHHTHVAPSGGGVTAVGVPSGVLPSMAASKVKAT